MCAASTSRGKPSIHIRGGNFSDAKVGIKARGANFTASDVTFDNVGRPWDVQGGSAQVSGTRIRNDPNISLSGKPSIPGKQGSSVGWRRNGPPVPAHCEQCKSVFPSHNYDFGTSRFYSRDNEEVCPVCGNEHANVSDGLFDLTEKAVRVLLASDMTIKRLKQIQKIVQRDLGKGVSPEITADKLRDVSPGLSSIIRRVARKYGKTSAGFVTAAVTIATLYLTVIQTKATVEARDLAREQTDIARQSLKLQKEALTDDLLRRILSELSDMKITEQTRPSSRQAPGDEAPIIE
jgi:hypothetical protein